MSYKSLKLFTFFLGHPVGGPCAKRWKCERSVRSPASIIRSLYQGKANNYSESPPAATVLLDSSDLAEKLGTGWWRTLLNMNVKKTGFKPVNRLTSKMAGTAAPFAFCNLLVVR